MDERGAPSVYSVPENADIFVPSSWTVTVPRLAQPSGDIVEVNEAIARYVEARRARAEPLYNIESQLIALKKCDDEYEQQVLKNLQSLLDRKASE